MSSGDDMDAPAFEAPIEGTPAAEALKANAEIKVSRFDKTVMRHIKRPKAKNLTRNMKRRRYVRRPPSHGERGEPRGPRGPHRRPPPRRRPARRDRSAPGAGADPAATPRPPPPPRALPDSLRRPQAAAGVAAEGKDD